ncbi:MAG: YgfZ/GcvT domain-containing protein [Ilumatobacteraceae bacterium]
MNSNWPYDSIVVSGADAQTYLHSQLSQDLRGLVVGGESWSFVLEPTGRVVALVLVRRTGDDTFDLRVARGGGEALATRLNRFRLRVKAEIAVGEGSEGNAAAYVVERVRAGWPAMGAEITEATIPAELGHVVAQAVSFTKGCYPGPEHVERLDCRSAQAPRRLALLRLAPGQVLDGSVGEITSSIPDGDGALALALVRRGADVPGEIALGDPAQG